MVLGGFSALVCAFRTTCPVLPSQGVLSKCLFTWPRAIHKESVGSLVVMFQRVSDTEVKKSNESLEMMGFCWWFTSLVL